MGSVVVPYTGVQGAFAQNPTALHDAVHQAATTVARGDADERARVIAQWHEAVAALEAADQGPTVLSTPQNGLAARLQSMIADRAVAEGKIQTVIPGMTVPTPDGEIEVDETVQVKFDSNDLIGWLGSGLLVFSEPDKHPWLPPSAIPETIPDDAKIAIFSDWGTGRYGARAITDSIRALPRCDVALHLGDTYYSGTDSEIVDRLTGTWPTRPGTINRSLNGNHEM
jgi:hypothetical protein